MTEPHFSQSRFHTVLGQLARDGIAKVESRRPGSYYRFNREHSSARSRDHHGTFGLDRPVRSLMVVRAARIKGARKPIRANQSGYLLRAVMGVESVGVIEYGCHVERVATSPLVVQP